MMTTLSSMAIQITYSQRSSEHAVSPGLKFLTAIELTGVVSYLSQRLGFICLHDRCRQSQNTQAKQKAHANLFLHGQLRVLDQYGRQNGQVCIRQTVESPLKITEFRLDADVPAVLRGHSDFRRSPEDVEMGSALSVEEHECEEVDDDLAHDETPCRILRPAMDSSVGTSNVEHSNAESYPTSHWREEAPSQG